MTSSTNVALTGVLKIIQQDQSSKHAPSIKTALTGVLKKVTQQDDSSKHNKTDDFTEWVLSPNVNARVSFVQHFTCPG